MNWGTKIVVGLGTFILLIVTAGIYMVSSDTDTLIDNNYYENSLSYDNMYDRKKNLSDDRAKPTLLLQGDTLSIKFTKNSNKGFVIFRRLADASLDRTVPFNSNGNFIQLPVSLLKKGSYTVEINWESIGKAYYVDEPIYIK